MTRGPAWPSGEGATRSREGVTPTILMDGVFHEKRLTDSCGLACLASYVRSRGHDVALFSPNTRRLNEDEAVAFILDHRPSFAGVSLISRFQYPSFRKVARGLRAAGWEGVLAAGGHWASLAYEKLLDEVPELDLCVVGDGELTLAEVLARIAGDQDWRGIPGVACRAGNGRPVYGGPRPLADLDQMPLMATDLVAESVRVYGPTVRVGVVSSRGCYGDCSYCSVKAYNRLQRSRPYRLRSLAKVVEEMDFFHTTFGVTNFSFEDDNFLLPGPRGAERAGELLRLLRERNRDFDLWIQTRPECVSREAMAALKEAGVHTIFVGTESFDAATLALYGRRNTVEESLRAFEVLEELGYGCDVDAEYRVKFGSIIFHPYVTLDALRGQAAYFRRYRIPAGKLLRRLRPGGDGPLCRRLEAEGLVGEDGEYLFARPEVANVYWTLYRFFEEYYPLRDDIRTIEKKCRQHGLRLDLALLREVRQVIESSLIDLFEELCLVGREGEEAVEKAYRKRRAAIETQLDLDAARAVVAEKLKSTSGYAMNR